MKPRLAIAAAAILAALASALMFVLPAHAATGFTVSGGRLVDANGADFVMRGVNHAHTWYPSQTGSFAAIKALGANTVRVVLSTGDQWTKNDATDVANVIARCKANRLICVLEAHDTTGYGEASAAVTLDRAADYWISVQSALTGQEPYVIVNIGNEPYGNLTALRWTGDTSAAIKKLRSAGIGHTIMVDAPNWGQDWSFTMRNNAAAVFASDPNRNTVFSVHMYGVFDTAAEINDYLGRFVAAKLPIVVGEFGHNHSDGNPDEDAILATTQALGLGYLGWSWSGNGGGVEYLDMATNFDPNALTSWGQRIFNGANGIRQTAKEASVYGGAPSPTPTPTPTPDADRRHGGLHRRLRRGRAVADRLPGRGEGHRRQRADQRLDRHLDVRQRPDRHRRVERHHHLQRLPRHRGEHGLQRRPRRRRQHEFRLRRQLERDQLRPRAQLHGQMTVPCPSTWTPHSKPPVSVGGPRWDGFVRLDSGAQLRNPTARGTGARPAPPHRATGCRRPAVRSAGGKRAGRAVVDATQYRPAGQRRLFDRGGGADREGRRLPRQQGRHRGIDGGRRIEAIGEERQVPQDRAGGHRHRHPVLGRLDHRVVLGGGIVDLPVLGEEPVRALHSGRRPPAARRAGRPRSTSRAGSGTVTAEPGEISSAIDIVASRSPASVTRVTATGASHGSTPSLTAIRASPPSRGWMVSSRSA